MDASFSRLTYLVHSYAIARETPAERQELMELIRIPSRELEIKALLDALLDELLDAEMALPEPWQSDYTLSDQKSAGILRNIFNDVPQLPGRGESRQGGSGKRGLGRWAWRAASVLLLIASGLGGYRVLSVHRPPRIADRQITHSTDAVPGGNKAVLILANGSKIVLDSVRSGKLAQQGGINVIKIESGRIAYSGSNEDPTEIVYNTLATPNGGQYQLTLPDGSRVWLNAASSIRYPTAFRGAEREVAITGEVYFEVIGNAKMPFVVEAGPTRTTVLGTRFNVKAYADERSVVTTLLEGAVRVSSGGDERTLRPGQQAVLDEASRLMTVREADTYQAIAWKNGQFDFDQTDIPTIMRQISRWYDVDVSYRSDYAGIKFGGGISRQLNLSLVLRLLDKNGVHTKLEDRNLIVLP
ncbi:MAG: FecR domain-containing protein [Bacteroidota bacterium]|nr:FecR domain-containing protein [Bacteroidota bacterium]MDP4214918.1 FecR domain-containing protein [Bacteroidota bacterium]MDP4246369.1 FecR domain-containing protein [Bacteroidota bacterium]MDP4254696.1 FecR domain-containing protein [Bacteroidota bacterium]MDP4258845.1 FecR domain-containing protein [Bacteroidota bacterium]